MLNSVESRINALEKDGGGKLFTRVKSAFNINEIKGKSVPAPYIAYVVDLGEKPGTPLSDSAGTVTEITQTIGLLIGIQSRNDKAGTKGNALLKSVKDKVRISLLGWRPERRYRNFKIGSSAPFAFADNGIWWMERFTTTYILESMYDQAN